jgi:hypothetical protein
MLLADRDVTARAHPGVPPPLPEIGWFGAIRAPMSVARHWRSAMTFRITGLPAERFTHLFALADDELAAQGAVRRTADGPYPCRVSLTDACVGDELILMNYEHHAVDSPYRMRFAIYVRKGEETYDKVDQVPQQLRTRTLAARAFDADGMMVGRELVEGAQLESAIERLFATPRAAYLHVHFAAPGCYAARVERA